MGTLTSHIGSEGTSDSASRRRLAFLRNQGRRLGWKHHRLPRNVNRAYRRGVVSRINLMISAGSGERPDCFFE